MVLIILSLLFAAALLALMVWVVTAGGGFVADIWYAYVIAVVVIILLVLYALWKIEDEYGVFSNAKARKKANDKKQTPVEGRIKFRPPYPVEGADETYTEFEQVKYMLRTCQGEDRFQRLNALIEGGYTPAMALYGYAKVCGLYGYKVDVEKGLSWLRSAEKKGCPVACAYLCLAYTYGGNIEKDEKKAEAYLKKALQKEHIIPLAYLAKGDECCNRGDLAEGKAWYEKAIAKNPNYGYYDMA
jgi:TPR repeat protein